MKSKFRYTAYIVALISVLLFIMLVILLVKSINSDASLWKTFLIAAFFLFIWLWMFFGELRSKTVSVEIGEDKIRIRKYLGIGTLKEYQIDEISGFKISVLRSKGGVYKYLYLMADDKKIAKISEYYHRNYKDLKKFLITAGVRSLGIERFGNLQELKDLFS